MSSSRVSPSISVYAPASVGNIGPGFDTLGMAVTGMGDTISGFLDQSLESDRIDRISGSWCEISTDPEENTASIAARILLDRARIKTSIRLTIDKGVPGSGLGSSAASAVGGAFLAHELGDRTFSLEEILEAALIAESRVSGGTFLDNISACLFGGITVSHGESRSALPVGSIAGIHLVFVVPRITLKTSDARNILPQEVSRANAVGAISNTAGILAGLIRKDAELFCQRVSDPLIEPYRKVLIPEFDDLKHSALSAGASGFAISGAGSTTVALTSRPEKLSAIRRSLEETVAKHKIEASIILSSIDPKGVRRVNS